MASTGDSNGGAGWRHVCLLPPYSASFVLRLLSLSIYFFLGAGFFFSFFQRLGLRGFEHRMGFDGRREKDGRVCECFGFRGLGIEK